MHEQRSCSRTLAMGLVYYSSHLLLVHVAMKLPNTRLASWLVSGEDEEEPRDVYVGVDGIGGCLCVRLSSSVYVSSALQSACCDAAQLHTTPSHGVFEN